MKFIELPPELLLRILDRASAPSCVCHLLRELVDEEASIQYKIELYAAGMVDSPSCNLPTPARLDAIRAYQDAWSRLKWKGELQLEFDPFTWTTVGGVLAMVDESGDFFFQTIPSTLRGQNPGRQWSFSSGTHTEDFGVDPSQNLIIFLTGVAGTDTTDSSVKLHIRSLEDGTPHPAARGDVHLDIAHLEGTAYAILICGPHAITAYTTEEPTPRTTFRIFNWKTGAPIALVCFEVLQS
ncbi:hypothetical protein ONZ45_g3972 [Pleurotus djamor]|nr:hypothetical protein ONZ45_g3972 [Pleurotus djamor]